MPYHQPGEKDPLALTGVEVPADREDVLEMARAFAEEFAAQGFDANRLLWMFSNPFYAGPHLAWQQLGSPAIREVIEEAVRPWRERHA